MPVVVYLGAGVDCAAPGGATAAIAQEVTPSGAAVAVVATSAGGTLALTPFELNAECSDAGNGRLTGAHASGDTPEVDVLVGGASVGTLTFGDSLDADVPAGEYPVEVQLGGTPVVGPADIPVAAQNNTLVFVVGNIAGEPATPVVPLIGDQALGECETPVDPTTTTTAGAGAGTATPATPVSPAAAVGADLLHRLIGSSATRRTHCDTEARPTGRASVASGPSGPTRCRRMVRWSGTASPVGCCPDADTQPCTIPRRVPIMKFRSLLAAVAAATLAVVLVPATAGAQDTTDVFVVHGLNVDGQSAQADGGTNVTVCAGDTALIPDFEFGQIVGPVALPSGAAVDIQVYTNGGVDCAAPIGETLLIDQSVTPSGAAVAVVATSTAEEFALTPFPLNAECSDAGNGRLTGCPRLRRHPRGRRPRRRRIRRHAHLRQQPRR